MKIKYLCSIALSVFCLNALAVPTPILNFDLNNTLLATDAAGGKGEDCMMNIMLAKVAEVEYDPLNVGVFLKRYDGKTYYAAFVNGIIKGAMTLAERTSADKKGMSYYDYFVEKFFRLSAQDKEPSLSYYDYLKSIEDATIRKIPKKDKDRLKVAKETAKKKRNEKLCSFVDNFDEQSEGDLKRALTAMLNVYNEQKKQLGVTEKEPVLFGSFFSLLNYLSDQPKHILLRTFGKDLDDVVAVLEKNLNGAKFVKAKFAEDVLQVVPLGSKVADIEKVKNRVEEISDPEKIKDLMDRTPYLAINDDYNPWNLSGESWQAGKIFFYSTKNSAGQPILPLFFDDNIELNFADKGIVRPVKIVGKKLVSEGDQKLINTQMFRVETIFAMLDNRYFIELFESAVKNFK